MRTARRRPARESRRQPALSFEDRYTHRCFDQRSDGPEGQLEQHQSRGLISFGGSWFQEDPTCLEQRV
jgi:hypothetical protein